MSQEQAVAFLQRLKTDDAFRARVMAVEDVAARMQLINAEGFACSAEEIGALSAELSAAELKAVSAGGKGSLTSAILQEGGECPRKVVCSCQVHYW